MKTTLLLAFSLTAGAAYAEQPGATAPVATALRRIMGVKLTDQTAAAVASVTESAPRNDTVTARFT